MHAIHISRTNIIVAVLLAIGLLTAGFSRLPGRDAALLATQVSTATMSASPTGATPPNAIVTVSALNVRAGPGTIYQRIGVVSRSDQLTVIGQADNCTWLKVITPTGIEGWVAARYVALNLNCDGIAELPIAAGPMPQAEITPVPSPPQTSSTSLTLVRPLETVLRGRLTFEWKTDIVLASNQAFEMILWQAGQDPMAHGFSPVGAGAASVVSVNLDKAAESLPHLLESGNVYQWGVLLVEVNPYRRLQYVGGGHQFRFAGVGSVTLPDLPQPSSPSETPMPPRTTRVPIDLPSPPPPAKTPTRGP
jgi:hypothetical protein